jgi:hypothetical protein
MSFIIFIGLIVSILVTCGLGAIAFLNVAFTAPRAAVAACAGCPQTCAKCRLRLIPVTPPELLAIADRLKTTESDEAVDLIRRTAQSNAEAIASVRSSDHLPICPLRAEDGSCLVDTVRPAACRVATAAIDSAQSGDLDILLKLTAHDVLPQVDTSLYQGLRVAGLDATAYELNGGLAVALASPDVARRWRKGDTVFAGCPVVADRN